MSYPCLRPTAKDWAIVALVGALVLCAALAATSCVTTRQTLPDGTVVETTKADAEQVALVTGLVQQIWTQYREYEASRPTDPPEQQADKLEQIAQLVQLLRQVQSTTQVVAPVPAEVAGS